VPTTYLSGLRLPGTRNHKNGSQDVVLHPWTLEEVPEPVQYIVQVALVDAARISEQASLQLDIRHEYSLLPCVRSFLTQLIRQRGNRNNRMYAIAWDLARQGASEAEVLEVLMEFYDRCYQVKGGTSRREHEAEARSRARVARGSKFNCREKPEVFSSHCGKDGCRFWRHWGRRQDLAGGALPGRLEGWAEWNGLLLLAGVDGIPGEVLTQYFQSR
jgi:hypothetical protein